MAREIKFRAWDKNKNEMVLLTTNAFRELMLNDCFEKIQNDLELMQYTGLKDAKGVEIYEGDVIEHTRHDRPYSKSRKEFKVRGVVEWRAGFDHSEKTVEMNPILKENPSIFNQNPMFWMRPFNGQKDGGYDWSEFHNCEVIGDIYQNHELLTN